MVLAGEVSFGGWSMRVDRAGLLAAVGRFGRPRARVGPVVLVISEGGISVRSRRSRAVVRGIGFWASPVAVEAGRLRRALMRGADRHVHLEYSNESGRLSVDAASLAAVEV
jgi:hypothetical protein